MTLAEYKMIDFLQRINKKFIKEKKLTDIRLKEFCTFVLSDLTASVRFAAMYDTCKPDQEFYELSRYIDQKIVMKMDSVGIFKRYDAMMVNAMDSSNNNSLSTEYIKLVKKYVKEESFIFNKIKIPKFKSSIGKPQKPQKFDPANLF
jgi:hypothetical protein